MSRRIRMTPVASSLAPQPQGSKIGWTPGAAPERTVASPTMAPQPTQGKAETRTYADTYFTKVSDKTEILYNGDRQWARVTLVLETAGPVVVGMAQDLLPITSGKGMLLPTGVPITFPIAKGSRLYIASSSVNRIKRVIEPVPWLEQITGLITGILGKR